MPAPGRRKQENARKPCPEGLSQRTHRFLKGGAVKDHRNIELFSAACDMKANGVGRDRAERLLLAACSKCNPPYPSREAIRSIASAYGKPRTSLWAPESPLAPYTIPRCIAQRTDITGSDKIVWAALDYRQRDKADCFPGTGTIAKDTGLNRDTVNAAIKRLEAAGLLTVVRSFGEASHYITHLPEIPTGPDEVKESGDE